MPNAPLFSVIIPVHNVQDYLAQCLDSVLTQTHQNFEIILVNDGSTDQSTSICMEYALKYPQITFVQQPNMGVSTARNRGIQLARGDYVVFFDSDDYWEHPNGLSDVEKIIQNQKGVDIILFGMIWDNMRTGQMDYPNFDTSHLSHDFVQDFETLVRRIIFYSNTNNKFIRRQILLDNHIVFTPNRRFEDYAFIFDLALHLKTYAIYNNHFYHYRSLREGSSSANGTIQNTIDFIILQTERLPIVYQLKQERHPLWKGLFIYWHINFMWIQKWLQRDVQAGDWQKINILYPYLEAYFPLINLLFESLNIPPFELPPREPPRPKRTFTLSAQTHT